MNKWLHRNGFTYKKPSGVPHKFSEEKQRQFIEYYEELKITVGDEPVLFIDGVHPTQATKISYGWIRKGQKKSSKNNRLPHTPEYHGGAESESTDVTANLRI